MGFAAAEAGVLVCDMLRGRRALVGGDESGDVGLFHAGRPAMVDFDPCPSSDCCGRREVGVAAVLRLPGRRGCWVLSPDTSRVPNLAFAEDSRP